MPSKIVFLRPPQLVSTKALELKHYFLPPSRLMWFFLSAPPSISRMALRQKAADVWEKDVWEFQPKSGSSGSCRLFLYFLGKIAEVNKRGRPSKWPPECLPSKFADFERAFSLSFLGENMTPKDPFLEGTFWDKFWRPIRFRALLFTPENRSSRNVWENAWKSQTAVFQTSAAF